MINTTEKLSKLQRKVIKGLSKKNDSYEVLRRYDVEMNKINDWCKTNRNFYLQYLEAIGLTELQDNFLKVFEKKLFNVSSTCKAIGIHRSTYYYWLDKSDTFKQKAEELREGVYDDIESIIYNKIFIERETRFLIWFAKTQLKDRGYTTKVEKVQDINYNFKPNPYSHLSMKELDALILKYQQIAKLD